MLAFRFCVRILRFSQTKILESFSWLIAKYVKRHFASVSAHVLLILQFRLIIYYYILYLTYRNVVDRATLSTYYFQWVGAVFADIFKIFCWQASDVFYVVVFAARAVKNYITLHCDGWLEFSEEAEDNIF